MPHSKALRYTMFGLLYFTQGTVLSYFTALNALYLLERGLTMTNIGIFATIALIPFVIKIFLGIWSDRVNLLGMGHRKPYILLGLAVQTACLVVVPFIDPAQSYWGFVALAFILQMGMALYDTCTDGLALDTTPEAEEGIIQGFMVGGRALGVVVTASAVGLMAQYVSWAAVFWLLAGLTLLPLPLVLSIHEAPRTVERTFNWGAFRAFKKAPVIALAGLGFLFFAIIAGANQNTNPFLQSAFGISLSMAGFFTTVWGVGVVLGSMVGGVVQARFGHRAAIIGALALSLIAILGLSLIPSPGLAWVLVPLFGLAYGLCQTVYFAVAMAFTDARIAASMFAILMAATNIGQGVGMSVAGALADGLGFRIAFVIIAALNLLALPLLPVVFRRVPPALAAE